MTLEHDLDLLLKYPLVLTRNHSNSEYYGYVRVSDNDFRIDLVVNGDKYNLRLNDDLKPYAKLIKQVNGKSYKSPVEFLDKLTTLIKENLNSSEIVDYTDLYRRVLKEYSELRQFYINIHYSKLSKDLRYIEILYKDEKNREHLVTIGVNYSAPDLLFQIIKCDLPECQSRLVSKADRSLLTVYENFLTVVNGSHLQALFDVLDEIDKNCWVLDPKKPTRKDVHRRIMLDPQVSIVLTFNSNDIRDTPQMKFLGPLNATEKYTEILNKNYVNYNPNGDIILELYSLLGNQRMFWKRNCSTGRTNAASAFRNG